VRAAADELGVPTYQPESLRTPQTAEPLAAQKPDLLVVVAYGEILRKHVLELAPRGALNVHPSLLPRYRGSAPVRTAILNGDESTGVSIIKLVRKLDAGPIIRQIKVDIEPGEDAAQLESRLAQLAADELPGTCLAWIDGEIDSREQDDSQATMTREWSRDDARIDWSRAAEEVSRLVRASQPWPVAWTNLDGQPFRVHRARVAPVDIAGREGEVQRVGKRAVTSCGDGALELLEVQPAGKRKMDALGWWNGVQADSLRFER
jgi:methionyl-tRNA formyltransferase